MQETMMRKMTDAEYFAIPGVYHSSYTGKLLKSPAAFAAEVREEKKCWDFGHYVHGLMSGDVARFSTGPDLSGCVTKDGKPAANPTATTEGKALIAAFWAANPGAVILTTDEFAEGNACAISLRAAEAEWGPATYREIAILWDGKVPSAIKIDAMWILPDRIIVLDYKTHGKQLTADGLSYSLADFYYPSQGAHYLDGVAAAQKAGLLPALPVEFKIAWVSTLRPFDAWIQTAGDDVLTVGAADLAVAQGRWQVGTKTGLWPTAGQLGLLPANMVLPRRKMNNVEVAEEF